MKRLCALFVFLLSLSSSVLATAQIPDTLVLDGTPRALFTNPLDAWLRTPGNADRLKPYLSEGRCSASWRGYAGTWEITGDQLLLAKVRANPCGGGTEVPLGKLFPGQTGPIVADWFSGSLTVPDGKRTKYVHMGYMSKYERYIILRVERGRITDRQTVGELPANSSGPNPFPAYDAPPPPRIVP